MKRIAIFTTTRAEFGIFKPLIKAINLSDSLELLLFVGGTHLSNNHGYTIQEIEKEEFIITDKFEFTPAQVNPFTLLKSTAKETQELSKIFEKYNFDAICILGDRYELLPIVQAAILYRKAIIHIHGGEKSEGVIDEQVRHMITKSAHIHFAACEDYAQNIIKMGESKWRVFNTGALAVDNMITTNKFSKAELFDELNLDIDKKTALLVYHPVTLEKDIAPIKQIKNIFAALESENIQLIITAPNAEIDRNQILNEISNQVKHNKDYHYYESIGSIRYLSLIPHCNFIIGNSSSGIIEVPYFKIPTINIGDRQKGRIQHKSVINTGYTTDSIHKGIMKALSNGFIESIQSMSYKFGKGGTAQSMVKILKSISFNKGLMQKQLDFPC